MALQHLWKASLRKVLAAGAALALPSSALAQDYEESAGGDPVFYLQIPANSRAEVFIGREPILLLVCLVGGSRATIDISSERVSRSVLEREDCVLVSEREVFATAGDSEAEIRVRVLRD
jgi:hypothetical protein